MSPPSVRIVFELEAPPRPRPRLLFDGVAEPPMTQEKPQVDLAHDLTHGSLELRRGEPPALLVHAGFVAGQRHHLAGLR